MRLEQHQDRDGAALVVQPEPSGCREGRDWRVFVAPGRFRHPRKSLLAADYSQIELRMLAHLAGDRGLVALLRRQITDGGDVFERIWNAGRGAPPETPVAKEDRDRAKRTVYGLLYGQGKTGLAEKLDAPATSRRD